MSALEFSQAGISVLCWVRIHCSLLLGLHDKRIKHQGFVRGTFHVPEKSMLKQMKKKKSIIWKANPKNLSEIYYTSKNMT